MTDSKIITKDNDIVTNDAKLIGVQGEQLGASLSSFSGAVNKAAEKATRAAEVHAQRTMTTKTEDFNPAELQLIQEQLSAWRVDSTLQEEFDNDYTFFKGVILAQPFIADLSDLHEFSKTLHISWDSTVADKAYKHIFNYWKAIAVSVDLYDLYPSFEKINFKAGDFFITEDDIFYPMYVEDYKHPEGNNPNKAARPIINEEQLSRLATFFFDRNKFGKTLNTEDRLYLLPSSFIKGVCHD